jgi:lipopolysaccharide export system permease protein
MSIVELRRKIKYMESQGLNTDNFQLGLWTKAFQPFASLSLVFVAISFIFGPLRETTMGMRVVSGLVTGIVFKFVQDLLSPASLVFGFPPLIATATPILICLVSGYVLLKRAN